ncbi:glutamine amidotransferase-related protein [Streptomyces sp. SP18CS02]|uniref:glutamine amidotransferase-related protein n=1 Tax=Streptomyces sp. SP18CS02 TaxID=3002531 RepID=UPI002E79DBCD|nr:hypothetical protein [Streptomyces sp. SP18CS02]MEE1756552.1 hypothetical protein [Streptomyces sp. SP18CS02]
MTTYNARIALVGDRRATVRSHARVPLLLDALAERDGLVLDASWVPTGDAVSPGAVEGFDAVWVLPGGPYRSEDGALAAIRTAREREIPFLGTCCGFRHALMEYARGVCGVSWRASGGPVPDAGADGSPAVPLACAPVGREGPVLLAPGSLAESVIGTGSPVERFQCSYGPVGRHLETLRAHGLRFTGEDDGGQVRVAELPGHPFFLATMFQPESAGDGTRPHRMLRALAAAATAHADRRRS